MSARVSRSTLSDLPSDVAPFLRLEPRDMARAAATCRAWNAWVRACWVAHGISTTCSRMRDAPNLVAATTSLSVDVSASDAFPPPEPVTYEAESLHVRFRRAPSPTVVAEFLGRFTRLRRLVLSAPRTWRRTYVFAEPRAPPRTTNLEGLRDLELLRLGAMPFATPDAAPRGLRRVAVEMSDVPDDLAWDVPLLERCTDLRDLVVRMRDSPPRGFERFVPTAWGAVGACRVTIVLDKDFGEDAWDALLEQAREGASLDDDDDEDLADAAARCAALSEFWLNLGTRVSCEFSQ